MNINSKDIKVYHAIKDYMLKNGYCPSVRELCEITGLKSSCSINRHLERLEEYGLLIRKCYASPVYRLAGMKYVMEVLDGEDK